MRLIGLILLLGLAAAPLARAADAAAAVFASYNLGDTDPAAALEMAKAVAGEGATVTADPKGHRLLVLAPEAAQRKVADLVAKLNPPPRNIRIEVAFKGSGRAKEDELSVGARGGVVVAPGGRTSGRITIQPRVVNELTTQSTETKQLLLVASGREARLQVGEQVPYVDWVMDYGVTHGWITARVAWNRVGSALVVEPTLVGNGPDIRVKITPELSGFAGDNPQHIRFAQAATELIARDGQPLELGGWAEHSDFYQRFLFGVRSNGKAEQLSIVLTPHVLEPGRQEAPGARQPQGIR